MLSELLKFRTTRTFWGLAGSALGLVLLIVILTLAIDDNLDSEPDVRNLLSSAGIYGLLTLILGVVAGAGEYRHGTIAWTLLVTPNRLRAVGGGVIACFLGGLAIGVVVSACTAAVALPWLSSKDAVMPSDRRHAPDLPRRHPLRRARRGARARRSARCCGTRWPPW